jgi:hypothetical protein
MTGKDSILKGFLAGFCCLMASLSVLYPSTHIWLVCGEAEGGGVLPCGGDCGCVCCVGASAPSCGS